MRRLAPALAPRSILLLHDGHESLRPAPRHGCVVATRLPLAALAQRGLRSQAIRVDGSALAAT